MVEYMRASVLTVPAERKSILKLVAETRGCSYERRSSRRGIMVMRFFISNLTDCDAHVLILDYQTLKCDEIQRIYSAFVIHITVHLNLGLFTITI